MELNIPQKPCLVQTERGFSVSYKDRFLYSKYAPSRAIEGAIQNLSLLPGTLILAFSPALWLCLDKLLEKLYAEREAIVFAAVMALKDTINRGHKFTVSATSEMLLQEFKQENDIVYQFIAECCEPLHNDKAFDVTAQNLYVAFGNWCEAQGEHYKMKKSEFKQSLANYLHIEEKKLIVHTNHGDYYKITLTENGKAECHIK